MILVEMNNRNVL